MNKRTERLFVDTGSEWLTDPDLAAYLKVGLSKARAISAAANARVRCGHAARNHRPTIDNYMKNMMTGNEK